MLGDEAALFQLIGVAGFCLFIAPFSTFGEFGIKCIEG